MYVSILIMLQYFEVDIKAMQFTLTKLSINVSNRANVRETLMYLEYGGIVLLSCFEIN